MVGQRQAETVGGSRRAVSTAEDLGRANAGVILAAVVAEGAIARAEIADRVGLTRATVTRTVARLLELGLLREGTPRRESLGRPMVPLTLAGDDRAVLTVHLGARECRVGLVDLQGRVLDETRDRYPSDQPGDIVRMVADRVNSAIDRVGSALRLLGLGASIGGWVDPGTGRIARFEPLGWNDVPLQAMLSAVVGLPIRLDQVVRGLALAERMFGAARGLDDFVELWIGNVVGVAVVHDGLVRQGVGGASGMIAHFPTRDLRPDGVCSCGRVGCMQTRVTDDALVDDARGSLSPPPADVREVVDRAAAGESAAIAALERTGQTTGEAAAAMADLLNPGAWIVAGVSTTSPAFLQAFAESYQRHAETSGDVAVRASAFGDLAPTIASGSVFLDAYFRDPLGFERDVVSI